MLAEVTVLLRGSCFGESRGLLSKSFSSLSLLIWSRLITYIYNNRTYKCNPLFPWTDFQRGRN